MAGRIPQNFIDDLLTRIDIIDVIDGYVPLRKAGRNHQALCPFHDEKTPSFTVSQEKQFYHCFGCGANGTAITFLMDYKGMDFVEAIEELASRAGLEVPREGGAFHKDNGSAELYELMELVVRYYCRQLREHPEARRTIDYLKGRGISGELAAEFELGFSPPGWDNLLRNLGNSDAAQERLARTGMVLKKDTGGYYDRFRDRIIFPIRDQRGRAIGFGGRVLDDSTPKYLNSPETPIFHKGRELYGLYQARRKLKDLVRLYIVEGYMDVLALAQYGIHNTVATLGTAVTPEHLDRLFKVCPQLIFCFDGDAAGQKAAWRALEIALPLLRDGRQCYFRFMPEEDDPDSFVRKHGSKRFEDASDFVPLSDHLLNTLKQDIDIKTREGCALLVEKVIPYLARLPAGALYELLLKDIASQSRLSVEDLKRLLLGRQQTSQKPLRNVHRTIPKQGDSTLIGKAIRLLLQHPFLAQLDKARNEIADIDVPGVEFLQELLAFINSNPDTTCAGILEHWRNSNIERRLNELAAMENLLMERHEIEADFLDVIAKVRKNYQKKQRQARAQAVNNLEELRKLYTAGPATDQKE
ncbi:MAG: primase [Gammaproteobacteria bacterium]|nr:primase [Gammaproteobacteria bacterium]